MIEALKRPERVPCEETHTLGDTTLRCEEKTNPHPEMHRWRDTAEGVLVQWRRTGPSCNARGGQRVEGDLITCTLIEHHEGAHVDKRSAGHYIIWRDDSVTD